MRAGRVQWLCDARWVASLAAALVIFLAIGHAVGTHYAKKQPGASCPFTIGQASSRKLGPSSAAQVGTGFARSVSFFQLTVGQTDKRELNAWLARHGCVCRQQKSPLECACKNPEQLGFPYAKAQKSTVFFVLDHDDRLQEMILLTSFASTQQALAAYQATETLWIQNLGPVSEQAGRGSTSSFCDGLLRQSKTEFHRKNVFARLRATNFGDHITLEQRLSHLPSSEEPSAQF